MSKTPTDTAADQIRDEYTEFTVDDSVVAVITDPRNDRAWIRSTLTVTIRQ